MLKFDLKNSKTYIESVFYEWLLAELPAKEKEAFCSTLDTLYWRSKLQRRDGFKDVARLVNQQAADQEVQDER